MTNENEIGFVDAELVVDPLSPQSWGEIPGLLAVRDNRHFEVDFEWHERLLAPNGCSTRDTLEKLMQLVHEGVGDEEGPLHYLRERFKQLMSPTSEGGFSLQADQARRVIVHAVRGFIEPHKINLVLDKAALLQKSPQIENQLFTLAHASKHRERLETAAKQQHLQVKLRLGFPRIDALLPGGLGTGDVLHLVGAEGGMKTALLLHIISDFVDRGGRALFFSLDMRPESIEERLLMRIMNCSRDILSGHIQRDSPEYQQAKEIRHQQDENFLVMGGPLRLEQMRDAVIASGCNLIAVDYTSLIEGFKSDLDTVRAATRAIRDWKNRWGLTFLVLSQMSRMSALIMKAGDTGGHALGGSSVEQLVDVEIELESDRKDEGLIPTSRLVAKLRKNRFGEKGIFQLFPQFPSLNFSQKVQRLELEKIPKPRYIESPWSLGDEK